MALDGEDGKQRAVALAPIINAIYVFAQILADDTLNSRISKRKTFSYSFQKLLLFEIPCSILSFGLPTLRAGPQFRYSKYRGG